MSGTLVNTTTTGTEVVYTTDPAALSSTTGVEVWGDFNPELRVTQVGVEVCFTNAPVPRRRPLVIIVG